jgi:hypothetical protein
MNKKISWKGRYMVVDNSKTLLSAKRVISALRRLRRENGSECLFSVETIQMATFGDKAELQSLLNDMAKSGEVYGHGDAYRLP